MGEIAAKTPLGRARIANASERLVRTVAEMGEKHRVDVPQGEKLEKLDGVQQHDAAEEVLPQFIPLPPESRVVLPLLMSKANAKLVFEKSVTMESTGSRALADQ